MTVQQMRDALKKKYVGSKRFDKMPDAQVIAIYSRLLNQGKL